MKNMFFAQNQPNLGMGYLYNWCAVSCSAFAPAGWVVPVCSQYDTLRAYLGGYTVAGGHLKETGYTHWNSPNTGADNSSGFNGFGAGIRECDGAFRCIKLWTLIWGKDVAHLPTDNCFRSLGFCNNIVGAYSTWNYDTSGQSVRLLYTGGSSPSTVTDYDGNVYNAVVIGTQRWTDKNWKSTHYNNGNTISKVTDNTTWKNCTQGALSAYNNDERNV